MTNRVPVKGNFVDSGPSLVAESLSRLQNITTLWVLTVLVEHGVPPARRLPNSLRLIDHKHLPTIVPTHCELQPSTPSCSKRPFLDFRISPYSFFKVLASFQLTLLVP